MRKSKSVKPPSEPPTAYAAPGKRVLVKQRGRRHPRLAELSKSMQVFCIAKMQEEFDFHEQMLLHGGSLAEVLDHAIGATTRMAIEEVEERESGVYRIAAGINTDVLVDAPTGTEGR